MDDAKNWLKINCPLIWSILNSKAKITLPKGLLEFISIGPEDVIENGKKIFLLIEEYLKILMLKIRSADLADKYRRELSTINSEQQLSEIFCEISVCATISKISSEITIKPVSRKPKRADFKAIIDNTEIYGEVKRYEDKENIYRRSILIKDIHNNTKQKTTRPRFLELFSKLENVYKQLPVDSINIIFLFHSSFGETVKYIKQVLFGESNFWNNNEKLFLESNSLFSKAEWEYISAFCLCKLEENGNVVFYEIFRNPNAKNHLPDKVLEKIQKCA